MEKDEFSAKQPPEKSEQIESPDQTETASPGQEIETAAELASGTDELISQAKKTPEIDQISLQDIEQEATNLEEKLGKLQTELANLAGVDTELAVAITIPKIESKKPKVDNAQAETETGEEENQAEYALAMESIKEINTIIDEINELLETIKPEGLDPESTGLTDLTNLAKKLIIKAQALGKKLKKIGLQMAPTENEKEDKEPQSEPSEPSPEEYDDSDDDYEHDDDQPTDSPQTTAVNITDTNATAKPITAANDNATLSEEALQDKLKNLENTELDFRQGETIAKEIKPLLSNQDTRDKTLEILRKKLKGLDETKGFAWGEQNDNRVTGSDGAPRFMTELFNGLMAIGTEIKENGKSLDDAKICLEKASIALNTALKHCAGKPPEPGIDDWRQYIHDRIRPLFVLYQDTSVNPQVRDKIFKQLKISVPLKEQNNIQGWPFSIDSAVPQLKVLAA